MYPSPHCLIAAAVWAGSFGSRGGGARDVFTEQNMQPRVQVSPISWNIWGNGLLVVGRISFSGNLFVFVLMITMVKASVFKDLGAIM